MKPLRDYSIPFSGLTLGKHNFEYDINDAFFGEFEYSLVKKAALKCVVELEKQETMLILNFHINGIIYVNCDKCLSQYPMQTDIHEQQIAKFGEGEDEENEDDEIITLGKNDHEIMIAGLLYEYINVAMPYVTVCDDPGKHPYCDKEMLKKLKAFSANNEQEQSDDPRWDALKNLNN